MSSVVQLDENQTKALREKELEILHEIDRICKKHGIIYTLTYGSLLGAIRHKGFIPWDDDMDIAMTRDHYERFKQVCKKELSDRFFYQCNETDPEYFHLIDKIRLNGTIFREKVTADKKMHQGIYVDIFPFDSVPENKFRRKLQFLHFHLYRVGLMSKFLKNSERHGAKKILSYIVKVIYAPFSMKTLYKRAAAVASKYRGQDMKYVFCLYDSILLDSLLQKEWLEETIDGSFEGYTFPIPKEYDKVLRVMYGDYMQLPPEKDRVPVHSLEEIRI